MKHKNGKYIINDIRIEIRSNRVYATIYLESYEVDRLSKLVRMLTFLKDAGFTKYETSYETGYYDSVENISLSFYEDIGKINMAFLLADDKLKS